MALAGRAGDSGFPSLRQKEVARMGHGAGVLSQVSEARPGAPATRHPAEEVAACMALAGRAGACGFPPLRQKEVARMGHGAGVLSQVSEARPGALGRILAFSQPTVLLPVQGIDLKGGRFCGGFRSGPTGRGDLWATLTQGSAALHPGLFSFSPYGRKATGGFISHGLARPVLDSRKSHPAEEQPQILRLPPASRCSASGRSG